jgi:hypothetical protein
MKEWYCAFDGQTEGPYSIEDLKEMIEGGRLTLDSLLWSGAPGNAEKGWVKASATELAPFFPLTLSPPAGPAGEPVKKNVWQQPTDPARGRREDVTSIMEDYKRYKPLILSFIKTAALLIILYVIFKFTKNTPLGQQVSLILGKVWGVVNAFLIKWLGIAL